MSDLRFDHPAGSDTYTWVSSGTWYMNWQAKFFHQKLSHAYIL